MDETRPQFPATLLRSYPHMFPLDIAIWERFLSAYPDLYNGFDYDVKVGSGTEAAEGTPENYVRMQQILSKYRIDAVGYRSQGIDIIEVKPEAGTVAIGQIVAYVSLYQRDLSPTLPLRGVIVTDRELPDMKHLTAQQGIGYYIV